MALDQAHLDYLLTHHQGRLATVGPDGTPQNKPVGYRYNAELASIDIGGFNMETSAKYRNVAVNPDVSIVVDDAIGEGASGMRFMEVRGRAERVVTDMPPGESVGGHLIRIHPRRIVSWNVGSGEAAFRTLNLAEDGRSEAGEPSRPALGFSGRPRADAAAAVERFVEELQAGFDSHDAEISNRHFASDLLWGSPFGATVQGYEDLHTIHVRLKREGRGGPSSRYEVVQVLCPVPDVALAHVRRVALDERHRPIPPSGDTEGPFSEMALYVLVRRSGQWWLAAGQNTPVRPGGAIPATT